MSVERAKFSDIVRKMKQLMDVHCSKSLLVNDGQ